MHPSDSEAQARCHARGKEECWLILDAEPETAIGIGLRDAMSEEELRAAALDGSIEAMLDWKPVSPGDIFYLPAGTIHAIGGGSDLARDSAELPILPIDFMNYGRPRELHLEDAVAVAHRGPWVAPAAPGEIGTGREILASGRAFTLERWTSAQAAKLAMEDSGPVWLIPLDGAGELDAQAIAQGEVWMAAGTAQLDYSGTLLAAYAGSSVAQDLIASS